ncbi:MAG: sialate O-acetylesterase [Planctomycetota bacterium]
MKLRLGLSLLLLAPLAISAQSSAPGPVRVFILAGQSNMEGKAKISLLERQLAHPDTREDLAHLRNEDGWTKRDDVWIKFLDRSGPLTIGYGSPGCIGPELEFGRVVGDRFEAPVLLIKTAWGGKSLARDFRPPSATKPPATEIQRLLANQREKRPETTEEDVHASFGASYRAMLSEVRDTLQQIDAYVPQAGDRGHELAGFVWFQGWNDLVNRDYAAEYTANLTCLIRDIRRDLEAPKLPFVIGQLGVDGPNADEKKRAFKNAQAAAADEPDLRGTVAVVRTDAFWDEAAHAVFKKGWREHLEEWNEVGSDYPFHYLGSVKTMRGIGGAFGEAVLGLYDAR